jgi:hypothetical protein
MAGSEAVPASRPAAFSAAEVAGPPAHSEASRMASTRNALVAECFRRIRMVVRPYWIIWWTPRSQGAGRRGGLRRPSAVTRACMRFGNVEVRPLGGGLGCLLMVLFSVIASVVLTVLVNLLL